MSEKPIQRKKLKGNQKLFLLGVTTFGAMLAISNTALFTDTAYASDIAGESTNQNTNTVNSNSDTTTQATTNSNYNAINTNDSVSTSTDDHTDTNTSDTMTPQQVSPYRSTENDVAKSTTATQITTDTGVKTQPVATATTSKIQTTIGNSVTDTSDYNATQKTIDNLNNNNVDIDQAYFGLAGDKEIDQQLASLESETATKLDDNGYLIKSGVINNKKTLVVQGKDATGLFYALNNVNNLINQKADFSNVNVEQSPQMSIRGVIEGFYGQPWSHQARKDLFEFMGQHKMNVYIYSPKDDDYLRNNWRDLYPQEKLDQIKDLVVSAKKNHVQFVYTLSPGNDITYSSQKDFDTTVAKLNQLRSIGVEQFYIALDDIPAVLNAEDKKVFKNYPTPNYPNNPWSALAAGQSYYLNKVQHDYIEKNNLPALWLVPTNYNGSARDPFKEAQGLALDKNIRIQWTGEGVFSGDITDSSVKAANETYHSDHIFIWDNFPVNDSNQNRLYLNPLTGRSKTLYKLMDGFTSNPMIQPYASWIGLSSFGEYMWDADKYNPSANLQETIHELAGEDRNVAASLQSFVDLNQYWDYATEANKFHAPILSMYINNFENAKYGTEAYTNAKKDLISHLNLIADTPTTLKNMKVTGFYNDSLPWINAASHWAKASIAGIDLLDEINSGKANAASLSNDFASLTANVNLANQKALPDSRTGKPDLVITPLVGDEVFQALIKKVTTAVNQWANVKAITVQTNKLDSDATTNMGHNGNNVAENMNTTDDNTMFWSNGGVRKGDTITVDLKDSQDIQRINIHQGPSDDATTGDMLRSATIYAGNQADGSDKKAIGNLTLTANYQLDLDQSIKARYIFIVSDIDSENWLQVRNISVFGKTGLNVENVKAINDSTVGSLFDGNVATNFIGQLQDSQKTATIEQTFSPVEAESVYVIGKVGGTVYVHQNGAWKDLGRVESKQSITQIPVSGSVDGIKLVVDSNVSDFVINEFGVN